jgi:hypothetical protein
MITIEYYDKKCEQGRIRYKGDEPKTVLEAFDISIEKWETILENVTKNVTVAEGGAGTCGLCMVYFWRGCGNCPILQETELPVCRNTPYNDFHELLLDQEIFERNTLEWLKLQDRIISTVKSEIYFLKYLKYKYIYYENYERE